MKILSTKGWEDYELIDSGNCKRLERFGKYKLVRPDPQAIWRQRLTTDEWTKADTVFETQNKTGEKGRWIKNSNIPDKWIIKYNDLSLIIKLSPFKHTGIFPEQSIQWEQMEDIIKISKCKIQNEPPKILNLFAYTGIASLICARAGAKVTHVDASKPAIGWARENQTVSGLNNTQIRWILDDAKKFVNREFKRGVRYDGIIMDPPIYGHGPQREIWDFNKDFPELLNLCKQILSDNPLFIIINAYAISSSALMLENMLKDLKLSGKIECGELALQESSRDRLLSTGIFGMWTKIN